MCDDCDLAVELSESYVERALLKHAGERLERHGRSTCVECDEPVSPARQALGAFLCMDCQADHDLRARIETGHT